MSTSSLPRSRPFTVFVFAATVAIAVGGIACGNSTERAGPSGGGCRETMTDSSHIAAIETARPLLRRLVAGLRAPGLSLAVAVHGKIVWSVSCGYADLERHRPVSDHTRFRIGSVSKTLTAAALMHYVDAGTVDLDAPINRYLPSFPSRDGAITLRRLAGHLAGIRHYETRAEAVNTRHFESVAASVAIFANDPLVAPPGAQFAYSSYGFDVIGAALEKATKQSFAALMRRAVFEPAHLAETTIATAPAPMRTTFYELTSGGKIRLASPIDLSDRLPAGGLLSSAGDLARFGAAVMDGTLVEPASATRMFTSQKTSDGQPTGYGIGFEAYQSPVGLFVGHTGAVDGGTAALLIHPHTQTVLALTTNLGYATADSPPPPRKGTPDPPALLLPFIER